MLVGRLSPTAAWSRSMIGLDPAAPECRLAVILVRYQLVCGAVGKFMVEQLVRQLVEVDYGSESLPRPDCRRSYAIVVITQSGETADTLAVREASAKGARSIAICNVVGSMATREADGTIYTHAGPEIGVASTKVFTCQLVLSVCWRSTWHSSGASWLQLRPPLISRRRAPAAVIEQALKSAADRGDRESLHTRRLPVSRSRNSLPHRARRRAEVERSCISTPKATLRAR
jgi:hypothetical protein